MQIVRRNERTTHLAAVAVAALCGAITHTTLAQPPPDPARSFGAQEPHRRVDESPADDQATDGTGEGKPVTANDTSVQAAAIDRATPPESAPQDGADEDQEEIDLDDFDESALDLEDGALDDIDLFTLDVEEIVTASRHKQKITAVPYAVSVITAEEIRQSGARTVPDALRLAAGVDVADLTFGNSAVSPRGSHSFIANYTLVLVDGRQIFDSLFGGTLWGSWPFLIEDIERIEVIRGPGGVTWGANAMNGVINIITKHPKDQQGWVSRTSGGSRGTHRQYIGRGWSDDDLSLRLSVEYEGSDGYLESSFSPLAFDEDYKAGRVSLYAVRDISETETLTLSAGTAIVDGSFPRTPVLGLIGKRNAGSRGSYVSARWTREIEPGYTADLTAFVNEFHASPGLSFFEYGYQQIGFQYGETRTLEDNHELAWGFDSRIDLLNANDSDPALLSKNFVSTGIVGFYVQDTWNFEESWSLSLGGRIDYEFYGGFQPSARVALTKQLSETDMVYGAVSRAFHMPVAAARFSEMNFASGLATLTLDRDLDPTTLIAYEIGYRGKPFEKLDASAVLFWHDYDEVTTFGLELGPPGALQARLANRPGSVALYGAEVELKYSATDDLTLLGNYTYQQSNSDIPGNLQDRDFMSPPEHKFMLGARYRATDRLNLSSQLFFVDSVKAANPYLPLTRKTIPSYFRLDLFAEYEIIPDRGWLTVGVRNLLDDQHPEGSTLFLHDAQVPRMYLAEFRYEIPAG